jgi:Lon protease-like protein
VPDALTLQSLPLFPLGTVLFPDGLLPLRIFEVRYLDMIGRCHKAGAPFGVVALTQGHEVRQAGALPEAFADVGTLASIEHFESPRPGLLMIRVRGTQRFRITSQEQLRHGLWVAHVTQLDADQPVTVPEDLKATSTALGQLLAALRAKASSENELPVRAPWKLHDCGWVANRWCELLPLPVELRQRLMALDNPLVRLELVGDLLGRMGLAKD